MQTTRLMDPAEADRYVEMNARVQAETRLLLHFVLASGGLLLAFLGWVLTL